MPFATTSFLVAAMLASAALAQTGAAGEEPAAATPAPAGSAPAGEPRGAPAEARPGTVEGRLGELEKRSGEAKSEIGGLKKLKFSGYVQGRFTWLESSRDGVDDKGKPTVKDGFDVRRGRLKATYTGDWSQLVLSGDFSPRGVVLRDAEAHLVERWTPYKLRLVVGQMLYPFGYEVPAQSSGDREMPERARVSRAFLAGERDRGARLDARIEVLRLTAGVFDGNGISDRTFVSVDNDRRKDLIGRIGFDLKWLAAGVSGWWGETRDPAGGSDAWKPRNRAGADLQAYFDLLPVGRTALKGELIGGTSYMKDGAERFGTKALGWYATLLQNLGERNVLAVRYDFFDPNTNKDNAADSATPSKPSSSNSIGTIGAALVHHWDDTVRATLAYEVPMTATTAGNDDPADNLLTFQLQAKF